VANRFPKYIRKIGMGLLKILADGRDEKLRAVERGKLFEKLITEVLRKYGYGIDRRPNVRYAGMEIDIEGHHLMTGIPLYAECKCWGTSVGAAELQAFNGKYTPLWRKDKRACGMFIAVPGLTRDAKGFFREHMADVAEATVKLFEEGDILKAVVEAGVCDAESVRRALPDSYGSPGDCELLYTDRGIMWLLYITPPGGRIPTSFALFDEKCDSITQPETIDYVVRLAPEVEKLQPVVVGRSALPTQVADAPQPEEIFEVRGSSACFEYQFPASPEYFVGRENVLADVESLASEVVENRTSCRGVLFAGNSGWGKSSAVLASVKRLEEMGHVAVAIDCRSAVSAQFVLAAVDHALGKLDQAHGGCGGGDGRITGFEGVVSALMKADEELKHTGKLLFIFFDQFENIFLLPETLRRITDLLLRICDLKANIVFGFSWKSDLIGMTSEFPYKLRDGIVEASKCIALERFSEAETKAVLDMLSQEIKARLRKDLRFFLSEFSQGYPWLLKKLCAHVKAQRNDRVPQADIAQSLLNVEDLFERDRQGLSAKEREVLDRIALAAPVSVSELGEDLPIDVVQSLVNRRLLVSIGSKYDLYWDIFRDYLNTGRVPVQENYILRTQVGSVLKATQFLVGVKGESLTSVMREGLNMSEKSFYNIARDMRLLGLARVEAGKMMLELSFPGGVEAFAGTVSAHLGDRLPRNRLVSRLLEALDADDALPISGVAKVLADSCPYISATMDTWRSYARVLSGWIDAADLGIFDSKRGQLSKYTPETEIRDRSILSAKRRGAVRIPRIQYGPIEEIATRILKALHGERRLDRSELAKSTLKKGLATMEDLGFISRRARGLIGVEESLVMFASASEPSERSAAFAEAAMNMDSFKLFVEILRASGDRLTVLQLGRVLRDKLRLEWTDGTAHTNAKVMINWAKHAGLLPSQYLRGSKEDDRQLSLL